MGEIMRMAMLTKSSHSAKMMLKKNALASSSISNCSYLSISRHYHSSDFRKRHERYQCFNATRNFSSTVTKVNDMIDILEKSRETGTEGHEKPSASGESLVSLFGLFENKPKAPKRKKRNAENSNSLNLTAVPTAKIDDRKHSVLQENPFVLKMHGETQDGVCLSDSFKLELLAAECDDFLSLGNHLFWDESRMRSALSSLKQIFTSYKNLCENSMLPPQETQNRIQKCRTLMGERLGFNRDVFVFNEIIKDPQLVADLFDETNLDALHNFVSQFESLELPNDFSIAMLVNLIEDFRSFFKGDVTFLNLSPNMIKVINKEQPNRLVSVLDSLSRTQCRSPNVLDHICKALATMELPRAKLRAICYSLSQLNYFDPKLMEMAVSSIKYDLKSSNPLSAAMSVSFLTICRKMRFREMDLVNCISTRMIPVVDDLLNDSNNKICQEQNIKILSEFINCVASLNVSLDQIVIDADVLQAIEFKHDEWLNLEELLTKCISKHGNSVRVLSFYKSLCILDLLTEDLFQTIKPNIVSSFKSIRTEDGALAAYERFCSNLILAHACIRKFPSAQTTREELQSFLEDFVAVKQSEMILSDASRHVRSLFERLSEELNIECKLSQCVEMGYVADYLEVPLLKKNNQTIRRIVSMCPTMSDSINLFEDLRGEKAVELKHLKALGCDVFLVDPRDWGELQGDAEKAEYLQGKWKIEFNYLFTELSNMK